MHGILVAFGVLIVFMILVHIFFRIVKFTISVFLFGIALIGTVYAFQAWFGIDLIEVIASHL